MEKQNLTLAAAYRAALETELYSKYHVLPVNDAVGYNEYFSRMECERAKRQCIQKAYDHAAQRLSTTSESSISKECATHYSKIVQKALLPTLDCLKQLSESVRLSMVSTMVSKIYADAETELLSKFNQELLDNPDYYSLYRMDYFVEKVSVKENDFRLQDHPIGRFLERIVTKNVEYYYEGAYESISEMEDDLNKITSTYYKQALEKYTKYIDSLLAIIEILDHEIDTYCSENQNVLTLKEKLLSYLI